MSIKEVTYYQFVCDFPGCEQTAQEHGEYTAWSDPGTAFEDAVSADWRIGPDSKAAYCEDHPATWASEAEGEEPGWDIGGFPETFPQIVLNDLGGTDDGDAHLVNSVEELKVALDRFANSAVSA